MSDAQSISDRVGVPNREIFGARGGEEAELVVRFRLCVRKVGEGAGEEETAGDVCGHSGHSGSGD